MTPRVLVACEFSGVVRRAFEARGCEAWSCDLLPAEDGAERHYQCDVREVLGLGWDLMIAHPPCTYLTNAGVRHLRSAPHPKTGSLPAVHGEARFAAMREAADLFRLLLEAPVPRIAVENPIPHRYAVEAIGRKYDQMIQPWQFGHGETKATCFWLKALPKLRPTSFDAPLFGVKPEDGRQGRMWRIPPSPNRWKERSRTYTGIAAAMAEQWGDPLMARRSA